MTRSYTDITLPNITFLCIGILTTIVYKERIRYKIERLFILRQAPFSASSLSDLVGRSGEWKQKKYT